MFLDNLLVDAKCWGWQLHLKLREEIVVFLRSTTGGTSTTMGGLPLRPRLAGAAEEIVAVAAEEVVAVAAQEEVAGAAAEEVAGAAAEVVAGATAEVVAGAAA